MTFSYRLFCMMLNGYNVVCVHIVLRGISYETRLVSWKKGKKNTGKKEEKKNKSNGWNNGREWKKKATIKTRSLQAMLQSKVFLHSKKKKFGCEKLPRKKGRAREGDGGIDECMS